MNPYSSLDQYCISSAIRENRLVMLADAAWSAM